MALDPAPEPFVALAVLLRRTADDVDRASALRRARTEYLRERWLGGRRRSFELAAAELDAITNRAVADLRTLARVCDDVAVGDR